MSNKKRLWVAEVNPFVDVNVHLNYICRWIKFIGKTFFT